MFQLSNCLQPTAVFNLFLHLSLTWTLPTSLWIVPFYL